MSNAGLEVESKFLKSSYQRNNADTVHLVATTSHAEASESQQTAIAITAPTSSVTAGTSNGFGTFEKLPAELRNEIYRVALIATTKISITRHLKKKKVGKWSEEGLRKRSDFLKDERAIHVFYVKGSVPVTAGKKTRMFPFCEAQQPALLHVSRQIYVEAMPILYAKNCFTFGSREALEHFAGQIGGNIRFLTAIELPFNAYYCLRRPLKALRATTNLRRLQLTMANTWAMSSGAPDSLAFWIWHAVQPVVTEADPETSRCINCNRNCVCLSMEEQKNRFGCIEYVVPEGWSDICWQDKSHAECHKILKAAVQKAWNDQLEANRALERKADIWEVYQSRAKDVAI
ncbi:hypothetical protein LTR85_006654 [Meristemomyces frigidus]|nr:hypothetical protein LTR85_006654 [Meristemomyces frigidus]